ncbi:MAG: UPF0280 family protein [Candidatus Omnitrophota bacterium]
MYEARIYRRYSNPEDLTTFRIVEGESDLFIAAEKDLSHQTAEYLNRLRSDLDSYIYTRPEFKESLEPIDFDEKAPQIVKNMLICSSKVGVGPMASVAGAIAGLLGEHLLQYSSQIIIENGGDIYISSDKKRRLCVYAGKSCFSERIAIEIGPEDTPCGICTSSGTVGHSHSFGKADAVVVISRNADLADAAATQICNKVKIDSDIEKAIDWGKGIDGLNAILIVLKNRIGVWGNIKLVDIS